MKQPPGSASAHQQLVVSARAYLAWCGAWTFKVLGGLGQEPGMPDLLAVFGPDGRLVAVECKTGRGVLNTAQCEKRAALEAHGAVYVLVRELEDLEGALMRAGLVREPRLLGWAEGRDTGHHSRSAE